MTVSVDLRKVSTAELRAELNRREVVAAQKEEPKEKRQVRKKLKLEDHPKGRPPEGAYNVERLTDNLEWIPDDGQPGFAFSGMLEKFPMSWSTRDLEQLIFAGGRYRTPKGHGTTRTKAVGRWVDRARAA